MSPAGTLIPLWTLHNPVSERVAECTMFDRGETFLVRLAYNAESVSTVELFEDRFDAIRYAARLAMHLRDEGWADNKVPVGAA